jgi:hypothetical protein
LGRCQAPGAGACIECPWHGCQRGWPDENQLFSEPTRCDGESSICNRGSEIASAAQARVGNAFFVPSQFHRVQVRGHCEGFHADWVAPPWTRAGRRRSSCAIVVRNCSNASMHSSTSAPMGRISLSARAFGVATSRLPQIHLSRSATAANRQSQSSIATSAQRPRGAAARGIALRTSRPRTPPHCPPRAALQDFAATDDPEQDGHNRDDQ